MRIEVMSISKLMRAAREAVKSGVYAVTKEKREV